MKKCWLVMLLCLLLAGCATHKPKPKGLSDWREAACESEVFGKL
ncbi:hypothetical protein CHCC20375_0468 [Bacillus licheniformis]|nr:hypothetical protein [Bacillus haynesii]TWK20837.1 hypothetical protein CHCC20375_0468 [Bacillus licheniformis]MEC0552530.1 hypothetical protein [Bacillus haynesii]MEC0673670.1 hypothetical protein [Bacillus haynesii]MEC0712894.1 hypothetical protein [Bacillus haynesii]MEC1358389.1 hypothetical protein [Bacillus haynesii]